MDDQESFVKPDERPFKMSDEQRRINQEKLWASVAMYEDVPIVNRTKKPSELSDEQQAKDGLIESDDGHMSDVHFNQGHNDSVPFIR